MHHDRDGLGGLLEVVGGQLRVLHLCHVEALGPASLIHIASHCAHLRDLKLENCSFDTETLR